MIRAHEALARILASNSGEVCCGNIWEFLLPGVDNLAALISMV